MSLAPDPIVRAACDTVHWACVFCRNATLREGVSREMINEIMEAIHEVPVMILHWDERTLWEIRTHLGCFHADRWPEAPDLERRFNERLKEFGYQEETA